MIGGKVTIASITICSIARPWFGRLALCWLATMLAYSAEGGQDGEVAPVSATAQLNALLERSDERSLRLNLLNALSRGDVRYSDRFGDLVSDEYFQAVKTGAQEDLQDIQTIEPSNLTTNEQIAYDVFQYQTEVIVSPFQNGVQQTIQDLPIDDYTGLHLSFPREYVHR